VVNAFTRECLAIEVDQGIRGDQVVAMMIRIFMGFTSISLSA
jgi:hypothetical protein